MAVLTDSMTVLCGFGGISTFYIFVFDKIVVIYEVFAQILRISILVVHNQNVDSFLSIETTPKCKALLYCSDNRN